MTVKDLSGYHDLSRYIAALECELQELRSKAYGAPSAFSGMASGGHGGCPSDRVSLYAAAIVDKERQIKQAKADCEAERERIFKYITEDVSQRDKLVASMMYWRFIQRLSWQQVAVRARLPKGAACRMMISRYLDKWG